MGSYVPPRRESIADHLEVARRRWYHKLPAWTEGAITPAFVEDLVSDDIICGPQSIQKSSGRGRGRRFLPRDYRDLLEVIKLKLAGIKHKRTWLFHLWLRGHEYPIEDVRRVLIDELYIVIDMVEKDIAPTGRWTEPFSAKYDRRVRRSEEADQSLVDILEPLSVKMLRPDAASQINPNIERIAQEFASITDSDAEMLQLALANIIEAFKGTAEITPDTAQTMLDAMVSSQHGSAIATMLSERPDDFSNLEATLEGCLNDGSGKSKLIDIVRTASKDRLEAVRAFWRSTTSGDTESGLRRFRSDCPDEALPILDLTQPFLTNQRLVNRNNPQMAAYIFSLYLAQIQPGS